MNCNHTSLSVEYRANLASKVFETLFATTDSFDEIGRELSYLIWAIVDNSFTDWVDGSPGELKPLMEKLFPSDHGVWLFVRR